MRLGITKVGVLVVAGLMGWGVLNAQQAKPKSSEDEMAKMKAVFANMNAQTDIPEVPEGQRASREQVDRLFEAMRLRDQLSKTMEMASGAVKATVQQGMEEQKKKNPGAKELTPEQQAQFDKFMADYMKRLVDIIYSDDVMDPIKSAYQRYMTADDVEGIIAFYNSPAGQHLAERQTKIGLVAAPQVLQALQTKLQGLMAEMQMEMAAMGMPAKSGPATHKTPAPNK